MIQEMDAPVSCDAALSSQTSSPYEEEPKFDHRTNGTQSLKELINFYPKKPDSSNSTPRKEISQIRLNESNLTMNHSKITVSKSTRKGESFSSDESQLSRNWICKNLSCKAVCKQVDSFCRRCSCCICRKFDENKDPSLWLVCNSSESVQIDSCNSSCHVECALENNKSGSVHIRKLDGTFSCPSCGNNSTILGCLKRQLETAKEARRLDTLCYRINLSHRLLTGTILFEELNKIIQDVKMKLENEVGPVDSVSASSARGLVSRLSVSSHVQRLCSLAIQKVEEMVGDDSIPNIKQKDSILPAACRIKFNNVKSSSLVLTIKDIPCKSQSVSISGYKLWYWNSRDPQSSQQKEDAIIIEKDKTRVRVSDLQPCNEYHFKIMSFNEDGDLGLSEAKCFTKSLEIINKKKGKNKTGAKNQGKNEVERSSGFKVRDLGKVLRQSTPLENPNSSKTLITSETEQETEEDSCEEVPNLDLNLGLNLNTSNPNPNPNADMAVPLEESRTEQRQDKSTLLPGLNSKSNPRVDFPNPSGHLEENFEYCVRVVRWLECEGYFGKEFRMKFLTWFSLRSSEKERRVVITFIRTLIDEPSSLAAQLLDSFEEIVSCKKQKFCTKLWH